MRTKFVSAAAIVARLNRKLKPNSHIHISHGATRGDIYNLTDTRTRSTQLMNLRDLQDMGREWRVLKDFEVLEQPTDTNVLRMKRPATPEMPPTVTAMFGNYRYSLTAEQQSAIQIWLRTAISEEGQQSPEWKLLHELTYAESWTPHKPTFPLAKLEGVA